MDNSIREVLLDCKNQLEEYKAIEEKKRRKEQDKEKAMNK